METHHRHYDNMPHGYLVLAGLIKEARTSLDEIAGEMEAARRAARRHRLKRRESWRYSRHVARSARVLATGSSSR